MNRTIKHPNAKRDSGGLIVYTKNYLVCRDTLVKMVEDCIIWLQFSRYLFNLDSDGYVCLCYNMPIGSIREIFNDKNIYDMILDDMVEFEAETDNKCNFLICGDLNAHRGIT